MRYMVTATESSSLQPNAPTSQQILGALAPLAVGTWVGPAPRVTRTNYLGDLAFKTTFAWPIDIADAAQIENARTLIRSNLNTIRNSALAPPTWGEVAITPYSEVRNGPATFWTDGTASLTRTMDDWSFTTDRLSAPENPIGPNSAAVRNPTVGETLGGAAKDTAEGLTKIATGVIYVALAVGVIYLGATYIAKQGMSGSKARRNPRSPRAWRGDEWLTGLGA